MYILCRLISCIFVLPNICSHFIKYLAAEILRQWRDSGAGVVVVESSLESRLVAALQTVPANKLPLVVTIGSSKEGFINLNDIINDTSATQAVPVKVG